MVRALQAAGKGAMEADLQLNFIKAKFDQAGFQSQGLRADELSKRASALFRDLKALYNEMQDLTGYK